MDVHARCRYPRLNDREPRSCSVERSWTWSPQQRAVERMRGGAHDQDNVWVFERR
jgi:hypothetical protein